ncbi:sigma-70 family RNA polymerase sigma factor family protein [Flindersiella endophytica]
MNGPPAKDEATFARLAGLHRHELRVHCSRLLGSYDESEDLVQETLLRAWQSRLTFEGRSSFRTWLYRIATNVCMNELASRSRRPFPAAPDPAPEGRPDGTEPEAALWTREFVERAWLLAIRRLPASQRMTVLLRDLLGWPARDAAEFLGVSVASANSRLQRGRETLRSQLGTWNASTEPEPSPWERALLRCYLRVLEQSDADTLDRLRRLELGEGS